MKILIPTYGYFPAQNYGGPPVSISNIVNLLHEKHEFYIVTSDHDLKSSERLEGIKSGWNTVSHAHVLYLSDDQHNKKEYERILNELKPDLVYLNTLFNACIVLPFLYLSKKYHIKVLLAPRGEVNNGALDAKYKKIPYIWFVKSLFPSIYFQSTCDEESDCIKKYLCKDSRRIVELKNIPTFPEKEIKHLRDKNFLKIVFISRISPKKNLDFALECLNEIKDKQILFDIYGPVEDKEYWNRCMRISENTKSNLTINYKGRIKHDDIFNVFSCYDLFFFPTMSENYGHVIAEALFSGVPVLISDQTPWTDVNKNGAGAALELSNRKGFVEFIEKLDPTSKEMEDMSTNARRYVMEKSNIESLRKEYMEFLDNV